MKSIVPVLQQAERSLSILVADDVEFNRSTLAMILDKLGHRAIFAENGLEAVECWRKGGIDTVLMDIQMPVMDGLEATRRIRQWEQDNRRPPLPIVALTTKTFAEDREQCMAAGMDDFLTKPISIEQLGRVLSAWVKTPEIH